MTHWQKIHAPGLKFYIFQGDEDGEEGSDYSSTRRMVEAIRKANLDRNDTLDITEYGSKGGISREFEVLYDGDTLKLKVAPPLLATDIKNIINPSKKPNPKPVSGKEGWVTYEFKNLQGTGRLHNTKIYVKDVQIELFESYLLWEDILTEDKKPLPGDPLIDMRIANSGEGKDGGMHGCTRGSGPCSANLTRNTGGSRPHKGIDLYSEQDTKLYSMYEGVVVSIFDKVKKNEYHGGKKKGGFWYSETYVGSLGNDIQIQSTIKDKTVIIRYCHLNKISVKIGDKVKQGQYIGLTGRNGNAGKKEGEIKYQSNEPHVHIQIQNNTNIDPMDYLTTKFDDNGNKIKK